MKIYMLTYIYIYIYIYAYIHIYTYITINSSTNFEITPSNAKISGNPVALQVSSYDGNVKREKC